MSSDTRSGTNAVTRAAWVPASLPRSELSRAGCTVQCQIGQRDLALILLPYDANSVACRAYARMQSEIYAAHGVANAKHVSDGCMGSCSHILLAYELEGRLLGGLRIHHSHLGKLPIEAVLPGSAALAALLATLTGAAELSGTVVRAEERKSGLSALLVRGAVAAAPQLGARTALGLGHQYVMPLYVRFGFIPEASCGCHPYPDARYQSRVAVLRDFDGLESVDASERQRIQTLRACFAERAGGDASLNAKAVR